MDYMNIQAKFNELLTFFLRTVFQLSNFIIIVPIVFLLFLLYKNKQYKNGAFLEEHLF